VTSHSKRTRGRSRKRRRTPAGIAGAATAAPDGAPAAGGADGSAAPAGAQRTAASASPRRKRRSSPPRRGSGGGIADLGPVGERPPAPWHPFPLSELLILIGAIGAIVWLVRRGSGTPLLIAGLAAVAIGTVEVTLREHLSGYRSHTIVLSVLPVVVLDSAVALLVAPFTTALKLGLLAVNAAIVVFLYRVLRARFLDARRERVFNQGR
jgi:hypothetical protein